MSTPIEEALSHFPKQVVLAVAKSLATIAELKPTCEQDRADIKTVKATAKALTEFSRLLPGDPK